MFPQYKWLVWMFKGSLKMYGEDSDIRKDYVLWLGKRLGYNTMEEWYGISHDVICDNYGGSLLVSYYNNSAYNLIKDMFPQYKWLVWMFKCAPRDVWKDADIRKEYIEWLGETLGYNNKDDWYGISVKEIRNNYGGGLLTTYYNGSPYKLIKDVFPEYKWVKSKFCNLKTEKNWLIIYIKNKERLNIDCIKHGYRLVGRMLGRLIILTIFMIYTLN